MGCESVIQAGTERQGLGDLVEHAASRGGAVNLRGICIVAPHVSVPQIASCRAGAMGYSPWRELWSTIILFASSIAPIEIRPGDDLPSGTCCWCRGRCDKARACARNSRWGASRWDVRRDPSGGSGNGCCIGRTESTRRGWLCLQRSEAVVRCATCSFVKLCWRHSSIREGQGD